MRKKRYQGLAFVCSCVVLVVFLICLWVGKTHSLAGSAYSDISNVNEKAEGGAITEAEELEGAAVFVPNSSETVLVNEKIGGSGAITEAEELDGVAVFIPNN